MKSWVDFEHKFKHYINILRDHIISSEKTLDCHTHEFIEIEYILSGSGIQVINDIEYEVSRGDIVFFNKNDYHSYRSKQGMDVINVDICFLVYEEIIFELKSYICGDDFNFPTIIHLRGEQLIIENLILEAEKEFISDGIASYLALKSHITVFFVYLYRIITNQNMLSKGKTYQIIEYIDKNCSNININTLANRFGYSENYFSRFFKKNFGVSFYLNKNW